MNRDMTDLFNESIVEKWKEFYYSSIPISYGGRTIDVVGDIKVQPSRDYILGTDGEGYYIVVRYMGTDYDFDSDDGAAKFLLANKVIIGDENVEN